MTNEVEKAIKTINSIYEDYLQAEDDRVDLRQYDEGMQEVDTALKQTLQEKAERGKGCEYCNHHIPVNNFTKDYSIEVDDAEVSLWEGLNCLSHIKIKYCPMCGRKLVEE